MTTTTSPRREKLSRVQRRIIEIAAGRVDRYRTRWPAIRARALGGLSRGDVVDLLSVTLQGEYVGGERVRGARWASLRRLCEVGLLVHSTGGRWLITAAGVAEARRLRSRGTR